MFLSFLKKWSFNLCLKLLSEFANFRSVGKLFQTIGVRYDKFFWPDHVFLKGCFSFRKEDLVFAWFWPDCLYISWKYRGQVSLKILKALEQRYWLNPSESVSLQFGFYYLAGDSIQYICFGQFAIYFSISYSDLDTKQSTHNQNVVELKHYIGVVLDMVLNICFSCTGI